MGGGISVILTHVARCLCRYGNDHTETSLLKEFAPQLEHLPTTNGRMSMRENPSEFDRI